MNERKRLIVIALVLVFLLICILMSTHGKKDKIVQSENSQEKISTNEAAVDLRNTQESNLLAKDYTNFTSAEKEKAYKLYGYANVVFTDQGMIVKTSDYTANLEDRLYTNIWPDTELTNIVIKPEFGEIREIEVGQTYLYILINDATEKDLKNYAKKVKKEYSEEIQNNNKNTIYKGKNESNSKVLVSFNRSKNIGIIHYNF